MAIFLVERACYNIIIIRAEWIGNNGHFFGCSGQIIIRDISGKVNRFYCALFRAEWTGYIVLCLENSEQVIIRTVLGGFLGFSVHWQYRSVSRVPLLKGAEC